MKVYGISMVRNEADIIRLNVLYHLGAGFDRLLVVDNGSTDGTDRVLQKLEKDPRMRWTREEGSSFKQGEIFTELAREAYKEGADWIFPVDADDFWHARNGDLKQVLARTKADALHADTIDFIQHREQCEPTPDSCLHMTWRAPEPVGREQAHELLEAGEISYVEMQRVPRWIFRPSTAIKMTRGAHRISGLEGRRASTEEIVCLHAPLRSFATLRNKAASASRRGSRKGAERGAGWHVSRWHRLWEESRLEQEWAANSYADGCLDVYGNVHPLVFDPTLSDLLLPFVKRSPREKWIELLQSLRVDSRR